METRDIKLSKWVTLNEHSVPDPLNNKSYDIYHSLSQDDYVSVLAITSDGWVPLVNQFRPAVSGMTFELPGGTRDKNEDASSCALRELHEETGFIGKGELTYLGKLQPDTGRLSNSFWCFFIRNLAFDNDWTPELGVSPFLVKLEVLEEMIECGEFDHALHIALYGIAKIKNLI